MRLALVALVASISCSAAPARVAPVQVPPALTPGRHVVDVEGVKAAYVVAGKGPVCIGMAGGPGADAAYYVGSVLEQTFTMVYLDLLGTGASDAVPAGETYSLARDVATVEATRRALGVAKLCIVGHSYGGIVAMRYGLDHAATTSALILYSTTPVQDRAWNMDTLANRAWFAKEPWYAEGLRGFDVQMSATSQAELDVAVKLVAPFYFAHWTGHEAEYDRTFGKSKVSFDVYRRRSGPPIDLRAELPKLVAPTLVITGDKDFVCGPKPSHMISDVVPGAKLVVMPDVGHFAHLEAPAAFGKAVAAFAASLHL